MAGAIVIVAIGVAAAIGVMRVVSGMLTPDAIEARRQACQGTERDGLRAVLGEHLPAYDAVMQHVPENGLVLFQARLNPRTIETWFRAGTLAYPRWFHPVIVPSTEAKFMADIAPYDGRVPFLLDLDSGSDGGFDLVLKDPLRGPGFTLWHAERKP